MSQAIKNKIQRSFSRSAHSYDLNSRLHRDIADQLFTQVSKEASPSALLDVGCGTGYLTMLSKNHWPKAQITGLDFSPRMLEIARPKHDGIDWVLGDVNHLPFSDGDFDILISNLAYQWAGDLSCAFSEARRVLAPGGVLTCTLFGYHTCQELFQSLDEARSGKLQFNRLSDKSQVRQALGSGRFKDIEIDSELIKVEFKDMHALIAWLKSIGANNLSRAGFLGREAMASAADIYYKKFSYRQGIGATFEVIRVYAKK